MKNYKRLSLARKMEATTLLMDQGMTEFGAVYRINAIDDHAKENDLVFVDAIISFGQLDELYQTPGNVMHQA